MKNIKFFTMAAAAAMLLGACSKENSSDVVTGDSDAAKMRVSFSIPANAAAATRTVDGENTSETAVNTVHVYVFNKNGVAPTTGGYQALAKADFDGEFDNATHAWVYTQKSTVPAFETISGDARIYVGINLPVGAFLTEAELLAATDNVTNLWTYTSDTDGSFAMFSDVIAKSLAVWEETGDEEDVEAPVDRSVSKLVATGEAAKFPAAAAWDTDINLAYTLKEYNVYNEAKSSYLVDGTIFADAAPADNRNDNLFTFDESYAKDKGTALGGGNIPFAPVNIGTLQSFQNSEHAALKPFAGPAESFYIGENKSTLLSVDPKELSRVGNTTYAMVATQVTADKSAQWNTATKTFEWNGAPITADTDLALIQMAGKVYLVIVTGETGYNAYIDPTTGTLANETFSSYYFPKGYVHFLVWLNHLDPDTTPNKADVGRNEFIHLHVEGIVTAVGNTPIFPGYPGDPTDPRKPIDPTEDTNNPEPIKPEDPIDGTTSKINVNISVNPWTYMDNSTELSR